MLTSLDFARELLGEGAEKAVSALEIKLTDSADEAQMLQNIREVMGDDFIVKNRYEQEEAFLN